MMQFTFRNKDFIDQDIVKSYTDYGICCKVFPQLLLNGTNPEYVTRTEKYKSLSDAVLSSPIVVGTKNGEKNGLHLLLDLESYEYSYFPRAGVGFTVSFTDLGEVNILRQDGFYVRPGTESLIAFDINGFEATSTALGFFTGSKKFCYTEADFQPRHYNLKTGFVYSMSNCLYSSIIDKIESYCGCTPVFATLPTNQCCSNVTWCFGEKVNMYRCRY